MWCRTAFWPWERRKPRPVLVSCPRNSRYFAGGQLAIFKARAKRSYLIIRVERVRQPPDSRTTEKQPAGTNQRVAIENGPAAVQRLPDRSRIDIDMLPPQALPAAHFYRNKYLLFLEQDASRISGLAGSERPTAWWDPKTYKCLGRFYVCNPAFALAAGNDLPQSCGSPG